MNMLRTYLKTSIKVFLWKLVHFFLRDAISAAQAFPNSVWNFPAKIRKPLLESEVNWHHKFML